MGSGRNNTRYPDKSVPIDRTRGATLLSRRCPFRLKKRQREDTMSKYLFLGPGRWQSIYCYCRVRSGHLRNGSYLHHVEKQLGSTSTSCPSSHPILSPIAR